MKLSQSLALALVWLLPGCPGSGPLIVSPLTPTGGQPRPEIPAKRVQLTVRQTYQRHEEEAPGSPEPRRGPRMVVARVQLDANESVPLGVHIDDLSDERAQTSSLFAVRYDPNTPAFPALRVRAATIPRQRLDSIRRLWQPTVRVSTRDPSFNTARALDLAAVSGLGMDLDRVASAGFETTVSDDLRASGRRILAIGPSRRVRQLIREMGDSLRLCRGPATDTVCASGRGQQLAAGIDFLVLEYTLANYVPLPGPLLSGIAGCSDLTEANTDRAESVLLGAVVPDRQRELQTKVLGLARLATRLRIAVESRSRARQADAFLRFLDASSAVPNMDDIPALFSQWDAIDRCVGRELPIAGEVRRGVEFLRAAREIDLQEAFGAESLDDMLKPIAALAAAQGGRDSSEGTYYADARELIGRFERRIVEVAFDSLWQIVERFPSVSYREADAAAGRAKRVWERREWSCASCRRTESILAGFASRRVKRLSPRDTALDLWPGQRVAIGIVPLNSDGGTVPDREPSMTGGDATIATFFSDGMVYAGRSGRTTLVLRIDDAEARIHVLVGQPIAQIALTVNGSPQDWRQRLEMERDSVVRFESLPLDSSGVALRYPVSWDVVQGDGQVVERLDGNRLRAIGVGDARVAFSSAGVEQWTLLVRVR